MNHKLIILGFNPMNVDAGNLPINYPFCRQKSKGVEKEPSYLIIDDLERELSSEAGQLLKEYNDMMSHSVGIKSIKFPNFEQLDSLQEQLEEEIRNMSNKGHILFGVPQPPLGLYPKFLHQERRFEEVCGAISRYYNDGLQIPVEWIEEYNELVVVIKKHHEEK